MIFGVSPRSRISPVGVPWMLSVDLRRYARQLLQDSPGYIAQMLEGFTKLSNHVDARNTASIRYLRHVGFSIHPAEAYGIDNLPFHRFDMEA